VPHPISYVRVSATVPFIYKAFLYDSFAFTVDTSIDCEHKSFTASTGTGDALFSDVPSLDGRPGSGSDRGLPGNYHATYSDLKPGEGKQII
jgi:hypothetical protein